MEETKSTSETKEIVEEVIGFSIKKFWLTIKVLTLKPGLMIADYCDGQRKTYIPPITYFIIIWGVTYFLMMSTGVMNFSFNLGHSLAGGEGEVTMANPFENIIHQIEILYPDFTADDLNRIEAALNRSFEFINSRIGILILILPIFIPLQWLFFRKFRNRLTHHLYFYLYMSAQLNLLTLPAMMLTYWIPAIGMIFLSIVTFAAFIYFYYVEYIFYKGITVTELIWRNIVALVAGVIPFVIWMLAVWYISFLIYLRWF